jgi:hypothetical protein
MHPTCTMPRKFSALYSYLTTRRLKFCSQVKSLSTFHLLLPRLSLRPACVFLFFRCGDALLLLHSPTAADRGDGELDQGYPHRECLCVAPNHLLGNWWFLSRNVT